MHGNYLLMYDNCIRNGIIELSNAIIIDLYNTFNYNTVIYSITAVLSLT